MAEFLSKGYHSEVYTLTEQEKKLFPQADLAKTAYTYQPANMLLTFYQHKIAQLLAPEHLIDIVGATVDRNGEINDPEIRQRETDPAKKKHLCVKFFSKKLNVEPDHQTFSAHLSKIGTFNPLNLSWKQLSCADEVCLKHVERHQETVIQRKLEGTVNKLASIGIGVPYNDPSDWCIDQQGNIVFFEIDFINHNQVAKYLQSRRNPSQDERRAYTLLLRDEEIYHNDFGSKYKLKRQKRTPELEFQKSTILTLLRGLIHF